MKPLSVDGEVRYAVAVLSFHLLGDARRDWLDPRTRAQIAALGATR